MAASYLDALNPDQRRAVEHGIPGTTSPLENGGAKVCHGSGVIIALRAA